MNAWGKIAIVMALAGGIIITLAHDTGLITGGIWLIIVSLVLILVGRLIE